MFQNIFDLSGRRFEPWLSRLSRDDKLVALGAGILCVQVVLLIIWNVAILPEATCSVTPLEAIRFFSCKSMSNFSQFFCFSFAFSIILAFVAASLASLTVKWRTQSGGVTCLASIAVTYATLAVMAVTHSVYGLEGGRNSLVAMSNDNVTLMMLSIASLVILVLVYLPRIVMKVRSLQVMTGLEPTLGLIPVNSSDLEVRNSP